MRTFCESHRQGWFRRLRPGLLLVMIGSALAACGGGGSDDDGGGGNPPGPPPPPGLPPVSATAINIDAGQQIGANRWSDGPTSTGGTGQPVGGVECLPVNHTFHEHAHVSVFLNGEQLAVPASTGIVNLSPGVDCFYALHTHNRSGMIHVEAAAPTTFTLGQFFDIWGMTLSGSEVAGLTGMPVVVYVTDNGTVTQATGDFRNIQFRSHREITIQVGTAITEIPNYTWTGN